MMTPGLPEFAPVIRETMVALALAALPPLALAAADTDYDLVTPTGTIRGTLRLPDGPGPHPVALVVAGSGPTDRDGNQPRFPSDSYRLLAQSLAAEGIASVRYDKRGIAASRPAGPAEKDLRFDLYVDDAVAWIDRLRRDKRFTRVAILGHSEGSTIAALAAGRSRVDAVVSVAGIASRPSDLLRTQLRPKLPPDLYAKAERILSALEKGEDPGEVPPELGALFRPSVQPYLVSWFRHSPVAAYAKVEVPVLILQGDADIQVSVAEAQALEAAAPKAVLEVVPRMSHMLKAVTDDPASQGKSYTDPSVPIVPAIAPRIAKFIAAP
jgi:alpha-beta hydrolase superfamily lysophospholipase